MPTVTIEPPSSDNMENLDPANYHVAGEITDYEGKKALDVYDSYDLQGDFDLEEGETVYGLFMHDEAYVSVYIQEEKAAEVKAQQVIEIPQKMIDAFPIVNEDTQQEFTLDYGKKLAIKFWGKNP